MNGYIGKTCPYCKTEIKESDDIVVCSACDMPHHKACWVENQGCTTFGCLGTIQSPNGNTDNAKPNEVMQQPQQTEQSQQTSQEPYRFCTKCGRQFVEGDLFCGSCGNPANVTPAAVNTPNRTNSKSIYSETQNNSGYKRNNYRKDVLCEYDDDDDDSSDYCYSKDFGYSDKTDAFYTQKYNDIKLMYIGENTEYYQKKFNAMEQSKKITSWNWCAFFFSVYWLFYRKLYAFCFGTLAAAFVLYFIRNWITSLISLGICITFGILGNSIYKNRIDNLVNESLHFSEEGKKQHIADNRGANPLATILVIIGYALAIILIRFL